MSSLTTGAMWSSTLPDWQRDYYALQLMETLRTKSILVPYTSLKEDFAAADSGVVVFSEVYDTDPNINALAETGIWLPGAYLDSRTVRIQLEIHGDILKFSDYNQIVQYIKRGDIRGLVKDKIGQNQTDYLDILARNAFLTHPNVFALISGVLTGAGARTSIGATDYFDPDIAETIRVHLEENDIPGVFRSEDGAAPQIVCTTTPRVIKDIRTNPNSKWLEVNEYAGSVRKFNGEAGTWAGVRWVRSNRLKLHNMGTVTVQTALNGATVAGQGAKQTVDNVYTVGQSTSTRYVTVDDETGISVGDYVTISDQNAHASGTPPVESDGSIEVRRVVEIDAGNNRLVFDKPLLKPHADNDWVTLGRDLHASIFHGGPSVVEGVGERPHPILPPKYDDLMMLNRIGWRGFLKFQMFRPEFVEVLLTAGSTD